mgnify:FL=1
MIDDFTASMLFLAAIVLVSTGVVEWVGARRGAARTCK